MPDVEKVIEGLEMSYKYSNVDENNTLVPQWIVLHATLLKEYERAIKHQSDHLDALLKAQEPRVLRVEEVVLLKQNDVVWLEDYNKKDVIPAIVSRMGPMVICIEFALSDRFISVGYDDYGSRWRCWSSRPTDKQREVVKWE